MRDPARQLGNRPVSILAIKGRHAHKVNHAPAKRSSVILMDNRAAAKCSNYAVRYRPYATAIVHWPMSMATIGRVAPKW